MRTRAAAILLGAAVLSSCGPKAPTPGGGATPPLPPIPAAIQRLEGWVRVGASDPGNPWALAHGVVAFGPEHRASDGRLAIDAMVSGFATDVERRGAKIPGFPKTAPGDVPVEPHTDLITKTLLEVGVSLERTFDLRDGRKLSLRELHAGVALTARVPTDEEGWRDWAWTMGALLAAPEATRPGGFEAMARETLAYVEGQQAFLGDLMDQDRPDLVRKEKQLIFSHTCGGLHVLQAALRASTTLPDPGARDRAARQLAILAFRYRAERSLYAQLRRENPEHERLVRIQELKFYGHVLETVGLARRWGLATPDEIADPAASDLLATMDALAPAYASLPEVRAGREQSYLDLIGDGCHAIRGLAAHLELLGRRASGRP